MPFEDNVVELPFFTEQECEEVKDYAYKIEQELIEHGFSDTKSNDSLGEVVTTNNFFRYNFLLKVGITVEINLLSFITK